MIERTPADCCPAASVAPDLRPVEGKEADEELAALAKAIGHPARVQIIRQLSVSVVEGISGDAAHDRTDDERIQHVFELNMGIFRFKFSMNFLMNLSTQLQIIGALLVGGWAVYENRLEIGGVVAFISGIGRITDPWGDLVNYFRDVNITSVKFGLLRDAVNQQAEIAALDRT